ncbi:hypothetical protein [Novosphingobium sp. 18050]|uniref:hypothetical protein n=1 Tax=Novosphingobium sp. 18050 TaxID=2681398 RepID=UPI001357D86C|nr:hypothetical protein [Novosphingobium sp. 18050]
MVQFQDLQILLDANNHFELTQSVEGLAIDELELVCDRVLASDPLEPLAFRLGPIIEHARELQAPDD